MHAIWTNIKYSTKRRKYILKAEDLESNLDISGAVLRGIPELGYKFLRGGSQNEKKRRQHTPHIMTSSARTSFCLRAGWMFHLKSVFGTTWQKRWVSMDSDGTMTITRKPTGRRRNRGALTFDLKRDCMYVWTAGQCQQVVLPKECDTTTVIEMLLTGGRKLCLCGLSTQDAELWYRSIENGRLERDLPTPRYSSMLEDVPEENNHRCCAFPRFSSKVKAIDYRPSTRQFSSQSTKLKRRVSWSKKITVIPEDT